MKPVNVLFIDEENGLQMTKAVHDRLKNTMGIKTTGKTFFIACDKGFKLKRPCVGCIGIDELEIFIRENEIGLVIIDNISRVFQGEEASIEDVRKIHGWLKPIISRYSCSFIVIHHNRKGDPAFRTSADMRGSVDFRNQCDQQFLFESVGKPDPTTFTKTFSCKCEKLKGGFGIAGFNFLVSGETDSPELRVSDGGLITENIEKAYERCSSDIMKLLEAGERSVSDIRKSVSSRYETIMFCLKKLEDSGDIVWRKKGNSKLYKNAVPAL